jgi:hypothetical protein
MEQDSKKNWQFVFKPAYDILIPDLILRILIFAYALFYLKERDLLDQFFVIAANLLLVLLTVYMAKRRKIALTSFLRMRLLSYKSVPDDNSEIQYEEPNIYIRTSVITDNAYLLAFFVLIPVLAGCSAFGILFCRTCENSISEFVVILITLIMIVFNSVLLHANQHQFISRKLLTVKLNGTKYKVSEKEEMIGFLNRKLSFRKPMKLYEMNDFLIIDCQKKIEIYKNRLESLSFESVFLGALSFASFIQISSQENFPFKKVLTVFKHFDVVIASDTIRTDIAFPLIVMGSLVSSVFYITVLIKRFAILKSLENTQLKIERAKAWNKYEEMSHEVKYTDQIQIELAKASEMSERINSNLNMASIIRKIGLYFFFTIVLIAAKMISLELFFILLTITVYGIFASSIMNGELEKIAEKLPKKMQFLTRSEFTSEKK